MSHYRSGRIVGALLACALGSACAASGGAAPAGEWVPLFDGATLAGWEGGGGLFRVEDGVLVGGTDAAPVARNEFLCRTEETGDFELRLRFLLDPRVNSGVQIRSQRIPGSHETIGYQADLGDGYWGALYDESRRNRVLAGPTPERVERILDREGWNDYRILAEGPRVRLFINDSLTVDYTETEPEVEPRGRICLQIHSGPPGEARFQEIRLRRIAGE